MAAVSVSAYQQNRVRRHELTRPDKEQDRVRHITALKAQISPVLLAYRSSSAIDSLLMACCNSLPVFNVTASDGVQHELWIIENPQIISQITGLFDQLKLLYIADGHHRSAAAAAVKTSQNIKDENAPENYFLSVIFPDNQLNILGYHRVVKDLNGLSATDFIQQLKKYFSIRKMSKAFQPTEKACFGMYLDQQWFELKINPNLMTANNPLQALDVPLLSQFILMPLLNIQDERRDQRLEFIGGSHGVKELENYVNAKKAVVAFALCPTTMNELLTVADAGDIMPPKSTWFEPKLADGLICYAY